MDTEILHSLCSVPTAPFAEGFVVRWVEGFVRERPGLKLSRDGWGNLMVELLSRKKGARWVFTAHMDHPGLVAEEMMDRQTLKAAFRGGVLMEYVVGEKVRFFGDGSEVEGRILEAGSEAEDRPMYPTWVKVKVKRAVKAGTLGMFDQGISRVKKGKFYSRVCDDLAGAAGAMAMLDVVWKSKEKLGCGVGVLLTRGEEEGFIGAIAAAKNPKLLKKSDCVVAIETSAEQVYAPQGGGAIIRVGDRTSVFNSDLSYFINAKAEELAKGDGSVRYQRALMPGGTCEATVYDVYGFRAASVCVALGNYHNMDKVKKRIGPEYVDVGDWVSMAKLFVHLARVGHEYVPGHGLLKEKLEKRFERWRGLL